MTNAQPTHTQTNTCPHCGRRDEWQVLVSITVHDWEKWCSACLGANAGNTTEPRDASGYTDDVCIEVIS